MRSESEIKLLKIRQHYLDLLLQISEEKVIDLQSYSFLIMRIETCRELLIECRKEYLLNPALKRKLSNANNY